MNNSKNSSGFVSGTLIHTQTGLKPIEQIQVGDFVLSKPEISEGEVSYQRVTCIYEYEDMAVYFVAWTVKYIKPPANRKLWERDYVVVTGEHPFWVKQIISMDEETLQYTTHEVNAWMGVEAIIQLEQKLIKEDRLFGCDFIIELTDGRVASLVYYEPILQHRELNYGITFDPDGWDLLGVAVRFTQEGAIATCNKSGFYDKDILFEDDAIDFDYDDEDAFVTQTAGFLPMYRKVFNIEVANTHTYFVGKLGAWVHNAIQQTYMDTSRFASIFHF